VFDDRDDPAGHESGGTDGGPAAGHLGDLDHAATLADLDPASGPGGDNVIDARGTTGVNDDLDVVSSHKTIIAATTDNAACSGVDRLLSPIMNIRLARGWHLAIAVLVAGALVIQLWIAIRVTGRPRGHAVGVIAGTVLANRILRVLSFFTVQSNILSGVVSAQLAMNPHRDGRIWRAIRLAALFGITVTGIVYTTVLARIHEPHGWQQTSSNAIVHYVVPIMVVAGWLLFGPRPRIERATMALAIMWPVGWAIYILIYGAITKWYPYPFLDVITHGYGRVVLNAIAVVAVLSAVVGLYWYGDRRLPRR
jgi:hypothetical protein